MQLTLERDRWPWWALVGPEGPSSVTTVLSLRRLKKKSQSVDIASEGFSPTLVPASPLNKASAAGLAVQDNNTANAQRRSPRCGELKRGYTIVSELLGSRLDSALEALVYPRGRIAGGRDGAGTVQYAVSSTRVTVSDILRMAGRRGNRHK
ncbi:Oxidation resistance protein 1 [Liparis tanakae]|uniref:Oxidation resistance protein 1 n=1 Tax=Liparis tanakae TaxID=230148 RepID=A0A4Z2I6Q4_9TELE|nr:Oxidation resistance protein 1 [Liparis tanakae]